MSLLEQLFSEEFIYALGWTVVHSLWQGLLIAAVLAFFLHRFRERSAKLRYEMSAFALFSMLIFSLVSFLYLFESIQQQSSETFLHLVDPTALPLSEHTILESSLSSSINYFNAHLPLFVSFWFLGALFFLVRLLAAYAYIQKIKHHPHYPISAYWQARFEKLLRKTRIHQSIQFVESAIVQTPMVIGFFKPIILMPLGALNSLSTAEVESILAHEIAHILRNDYLINIIQSVIEILFYFNPAVWWISAQVRMERENCCDDIAVRLCGSSLTYAKALVKLQEINKGVPKLAMPLANNKEHLLNRIKRILNQPQNKSNVMEKITASGLLLLAVLFLSLSSGKAFQQKEQVAIVEEQTPLLAVMPVPEEEEQEPILATINETPEVAKIVQTDSIVPGDNRSMTFKHQGNGKDVHVKLEDGQIQSLSINGEDIPEEDFADYEDVVKEIMDNVPAAPPAPPTPPRFKFFAPPPPPAPPAAGATGTLPAPPAPPAPGASSQFPEGTSANRFMWSNKKLKVLKSKDEEGDQVIIVEGQDLENPIEIKVDGEVIYLNGEKMEDGNEFIFKNDGNFKFKFDKHSYRTPEQLYKTWERLDLNDSDNDIFEIYRHPKRLKGKVYKAEELAELWEQQEDLHSEQQSAKIEELKAHLKNKQLKLFKADNFDFQNYRGLFSESDRDNRRFSRFFSTIEKELLKDGLIKDTKRYRLKLTDRKMKVNGRKKSAEMRDKYIQLYKRIIDDQVDTDFAVEINKNGKKLKTSISR